MNKLSIVVGLSSALLLLLSTVLFSVVRMNDVEVALRKRVEAQNDVCKANFDKMFKIIAQTAEVSNEYSKTAKESFKEIYIPLMEGRYSNERGGALMSWVHENNPEFDLNAMSKMYERLQIVIESNRQEFFHEQKKLIDMKREYDTYTQKFLQSIFIKSVDIEINIITSSNTEEVYKTNKDNNVKLF